MHVLDLDLEIVMPNGDIALSKTDRIKEQRIEETRQAAIDQAREVKNQLGKGLEYFESVAEGKPWFEGIYPHQWDGILFGTAAKRWICGDGMGLGKTREAVGWLDTVGAKRVLIICEANICAQFAGEVMDLAPHRFMTNLAKLDPARRHNLMDEAAMRGDGVIVVNYEIWRRDQPLEEGGMSIWDKVHAWQPDTIIVDEAHNIKGTNTANYKYIRGLVEIDNTCAKCSAYMPGLYDEAQRPKLVPLPCKACGWKVGDPLGFTYKTKLDGWLTTKSVKNLMFTTGTPILNSPLDLFPMLHLCDPITFPRLADFTGMFCVKNYAGKWEFRAMSLNFLKPKIEGRFLARSLSDAGITLPKQRVHVIPVDLDPKEYPLQAKIIDQITHAAQIVLENGNQHMIMHMISLILRKRQANVFPGGIEIRDSDGEIIFKVGDEIIESVKIDTLVDNAMSFHKKGHRQVVFSQFKTALKELELQFKLEGVRAVRFDGDTPEDLRREIKTNFYAAKGEAPKWDVVLCNYKTGGTGLNLTAATVTHVLDEEWNPGKQQQSFSRTHRIGQEHETDVFIYRIPRSIDTWMSNLNKRKQGIVDGFNEVVTQSADEQVDEFLNALKSGEIR